MKTQKFGCWRPTVLKKVPCNDSTALFVRCGNRNTEIFFLPTDGLDTVENEQSPGGRPRNLSFPTKATSNPSWKSV